MDIIKEENLDDFLSKLLLEPEGINFVDFAKKYDFKLPEVESCFNMVSIRNSDWVKFSDLKIFIPQAYLPVVKFFLSNGGYTERKRIENLKNETLALNMQLIRDQIKEIESLKKNRYMNTVLSGISIGMSFISVLIALAVLIFGDQVIEHYL
ncbi:hypothetical protein [Chryseobacterium balustinum]|uniref:hypothetical protein n=1 Tax=Chryseobacterium balustinum TaxID=246 RepID=UPI003CEC1B06